MIFPDGFSAEEANAYEGNVFQYLLGFSSQSVYKNWNKRIAKFLSVLYTLLFRKKMHLSKRVLRVSIWLSHRHQKFMGYINLRGGAQCRWGKDRRASLSENIIRARMSFRCNT